MTSLADEFVGATRRGAGRYSLVYRSIDHRTLKELCAAARKQNPPTKFVPHFPSGGFSADMQAFSTTMIELQEKRHRADYDPQPRFRTSDANLAISAARRAILQFQATSEEHRKTFLTLLICPPC